MHARFIGRLALAGLALQFLALPAWGQPGRGYGDREDRGDRGDRGSRGGGPGGFDVRGMLQRMDQNGNGVIDPNEMTGRGGSFVRGMAERAGLNPSQPLSIDKLAAGSMQQDRGGRDDRDRDRDRDRGDRDRDRDRDRGSSSGSGSPAAVPPSGVQGFGLAADAGAAPAARGFDVPLTPVAGQPIEARFDDRVVEYVKENILRERDANKNNVLERNEWTGRWSTPPEESDLNKDGILSMEELCLRMSKRFNLDNARDGDRDSRSSSGSGSSGGPPTAAPGGSPPSDAARYRGYAESLIRQYDDNKNGLLERDEWKDMRSEQQAADANKDQVITVEELATSLQAYSAGGGSGGYGSRSSGWGSRGDRSERGGDRGGFGSRTAGGESGQPAAKRSYRVSSPTERLPKGVPDYFYRNDTDADGQISMSEYATSWNDQIAAEFQRLDKNGDGILTADECVREEGRDGR